MKKYLGVILAAMLLLSGCAENRYAVKEAAQAETEWKPLYQLRTKQYEDGIGEFVQKSAAAILSDDSTENRLYSPLNLYFTLAMLAEMTEGNSRAQILEVLETEKLESLREKVTVLRGLNTCDDGTMMSEFYNSVWLDDSISYDEDLLRMLADTYTASSYSGDMGSEEYEQVFRNWMNEQTGGLLEKSADMLSFSEETLLTLASTVNYRAEWHTEFSEENTEKAVFHAPSEEVECDFMYRMDETNYYWGENYAAIRLFFNGYKHSMWFILPDEDVQVTELLDDPEVTSLCMNGKTGGDFSKEYTGNSEYLKVHMRIPKFDISSDFELSSMLECLGITEVLDAEAADFSPVTQEEVKSIFVDEIRHAVRLAVDEEGCTAAAFTAVDVVMAPPPPDEEVEITFDRPFLFVVSGADQSVLFMGIVNDPSETN